LFVFDDNANALVISPASHFMVASMIGDKTDATLGYSGSAVDVELAVAHYFPNTILSVDAALKGRTIHAGGRCSVILDGHTQFIKDVRTPLP
jgi:hypothetical protein